MVDASGLPLTRVVGDITYTAAEQAGGGVLRTATKRVCLEQDGPGLDALRQELEERGRRYEAAESELSSVVSQVQAREAWWQAGAQRMEAGVAGGLQPRAQLVTEAEANWQADRTRMLAALTNAEASLGSQSSAAAAAINGAAAVEAAAR